MAGWPIPGIAVHRWQVLLPCSTYCHPNAPCKIVCVLEDVGITKARTEGVKKKERKEERKEGVEKEMTALRNEGVKI